MASTAQDSSAPLRTEKKDEDVDESTFEKEGKERKREQSIARFFSMSIAREAEEEG